MFVHEQFSQGSKADQAFAPPRPLPTPAPPAKLGSWLFPLPRPWEFNSLAKPFTKMHLSLLFSGHTQQPDLD
jgi:hypothetical protein